MPHILTPFAYRNRNPREGPDKQVCDEFNKGDIMAQTSEGTLTVFKFNSAYGADRALSLIQELQQRQLLELHDAATVSWAPDSKKPKTKQLMSTTGIGALDGAFWGMLFGLLFFVPLAGAAFGALLGGMTGSFADFGIDDKFINSVREKVVPGTSALFLLTKNVVLDKVSEEFRLRDIHMELISSNLSKDQENKLKSTFGG